jgi:hypothetical protein
MFVKRNLVVIASIVVLLAPLPACNNDDTTASRLYTVTYSLTIQGNQSTVTVLTYRTQSGTTTVNNPTNGWSIQVAVSGGTTIGMTAQGTVNNGMIQINMEGREAGGGNQVTGQDSCSAQGLAVPCNLDIPETTVPS